MANDSTDHRKIYGRGFHDGLKEAERMNQSRMESIERGLNGVAKKVYECVPIQEAWNVKQVLAEMARVTGSKPAFDVVQGCLATMVDSGLIKQTGEGFQRHAHKPKPTLVVAPDPAPPKTLDEKVSAAQPEAVDSVSRGAELVAKLRASARELNALADDLDDVLLSVEVRVEEAQRGSEKMRRLQELLKSLST